MKKMIITLCVIAGSIATFGIINYVATPTTSAKYRLGILQTASHPALDAAREGFMQELKNSLGNDIAFTVYNAQGSVAQAYALAQQLHANARFDGFFTIATPATQALTAVEKERPIVIAAVTDPHALGIIHATTNVCGTQDMVNSNEVIQTLVQLIPTAKKVGLIYTSGETNSMVLAQRMRQELEKRELRAQDFAITSELDLPAMIELACRQSDVILAPTDNTIASAIALVASLALKYKKPLIVCDTMLVRYGALAARGIDYTASGRQAARRAYAVLVEGKKPYELPIEHAESNTVFWNNTTAAFLHITIPEQLKEPITIIQGNQ